MVIFYNSSHSLTQQTEAVSSALKLTRKAAAVATIFTTYVCFVQSIHLCVLVLHVQLERIIVIIAAIPRNWMCVTVCWGTHFLYTSGSKNIKNRCIIMINDWLITFSNTV
jgi:hypothetical protein